MAERYVDREYCITSLPSIPSHVTRIIDYRCKKYSVHRVGLLKQCMKPRPPRRFRPVRQKM